MKKKTNNQISLLVAALAITPFIFFLGKNSLQAFFFTSEYFWFSVIYSLFFIFFATFANLFLKKILFFILFLAYFNFLQLYFVDIEQVLMIYKSGSTGYYVIGFIILISLIGTFLSRSSVFRSFIFIVLFLNVTHAVINLTPVIDKSLQTFLNTTDILNKTLNLNSSTSKKYPNIFYIIPDGLASPKILNEYADIDFKDSIKKFEEKGFSVPEHTYSSYNMTHLSFAALFQMDYPVTEKSKKYKNLDNFYPSIRNQNPKIIQYLKKYNYKFIIFPPRWGGCPKSKVYKCLRPIDNTFLSNLFADYAISAMLEHSLIKKIYFLSEILLFKDIDDASKTALKHLKINPEYWDDNGSFTMIHMNMPHTPFRKENCSIIGTSALPNKESYKSSVYCAFNRIHELVDFIIKKYPNASIVVQSDHGVTPTIYPKNKKFAEISNSFIDHRLGAFSAVRGCNANQAAKLNSANIVRYIVECLVGSKPTKQLENKSYWGFYNDDTEFGKIHRIH